MRSFPLSWDGDDRLQQVLNGSSVWLSASYDGDGGRVSKTDFWTGAHNYSFGPGGIVGDSNGSTVYTPGFAQRQGSTDRFFHPDWLGSSRYLTDSTGNSAPSALRFDAYGNRSATGGTDPYDPSEFQFAGTSGYQTEYASSTEPGVGLQYLQNRYYDPVAGRFLSPDPIGFEGGLNLYGSVEGNPASAADPDRANLLLCRTMGAEVHEGDGAQRARCAAVDSGAAGRMEGTQASRMADCR